jgi:hypothetical protein
MLYYVVSGGTVVSATHYRGRWTAFRTVNRAYATPLSHKHAIAFAHKAQGEIITENQFSTYTLNPNQ